MSEVAKLTDIFADDVNLRWVEPHICSVFSDDAESGSYDRMFGTIYDRVACNRLYNRLVWGYSINEYHRLCLEALGSSRAGWVLDAGCGSLAFTVHTYASYSGRPVLFLDRSIKLLRMAKIRLNKRIGRIPAEFVFLHADVCRLPFKAQCFGTLISLNLLHVLPDKGVQDVLQEIKRVLIAPGTLFLTTLVENNRFADRYLHMWGRAGEVVPRSVIRLLRLCDALGMSVNCRVRGNLAFITLK